ncbi:hypothetical protein [Burkholderia cenocepacia]|uniref:hypothetical protein n=1 Tax=Burkholderia cenocepacia TaxID=95486 RepID=UPI00406C4424
MEGRDGQGDRGRAEPPFDPLEQRDPGLAGPVLQSDVQRLVARAYRRAYDPAVRDRA